MAVGIIAEYNPFHNGHLYHLEKIKEMYPDEVVVLVLSGNFTQRGDVSVIDKWKKTEIAKKAGIDLIVELPLAFAIQSADFFSYGAITILESLKVDKVVFGSECDDIEFLYTIAKVQIENEEFDTLVKMYSKFGENYPTAISKAVYDLAGVKVFAPNDLLGISYIKTILMNNYSIKPVIIKRTTDYHMEELNFLTSGTTIRKYLKNGCDVGIAIPSFVKDYMVCDYFHFIDDYFGLLKYKVISSDDLSKYQTVDEGIDKLLKKVIIDCSSYEELILKLKSKRFTYNKISRMLLHILLGFTKEKNEQFRDVSYIRILGFNDKGQRYLNSIKKKTSLPILSKFERGYPMLEFELYATVIYSLAKGDNELIFEEYRNHLKKEVL